MPDGSFTLLRRSSMRISVYFIYVGACLLACAAAAFSGSVLIDHGWLLRLSQKAMEQLGNQSSFSADKNHWNQNYGKKLGSTFGKILVVSENFVSRDFLSGLCASLASALLRPRLREVCPVPVSNYKWREWHRASVALRSSCFEEAPQTQAAPPEASARIPPAPETFNKQQQASENVQLNTGMGQTQVLFPVGFAPAKFFLIWWVIRQKIVKINKVPKFYHKILLFTVIVNWCRLPWSLSPKWKKWLGKGLKC